MLERVTTEIYRTTDARYYVMRNADGWEIMRRTGVTIGLATVYELMEATQAIEDIIEEDRNGRAH